MSITNKIFESLNEKVDEDNQSKVLRAMNFLIDDENEAIEGYSSKRDEIKGSLGQEDFDEVDKVFSHIILEEKQHISEIKELKSKLGL